MILGKDHREGWHIHAIMFGLGPSLTVGGAVGYLVATVVYALIWWLMRRRNYDLKLRYEGLVIFAVVWLFSMFLFVTLLD